MWVFGEKIERARSKATAGRGEYFLSIATQLILLHPHPHPLLLLLLIHPLRLLLAVASAASSSVRSVSVAAVMHELFGKDRENDDDEAMTIGE